MLRACPPADGSDHEHGDRIAHALDDSGLLVAGVGDPDGICKLTAQGDLDPTFGAGGVAFPRRALPSGLIEILGDGPGRLRPSDSTGASANSTLDSGLGVHGSSADGSGYRATVEQRHGVKFALGSSPQWRRYRGALLLMGPPVGPGEGSGG
jgi:hypothetical protein